MLSYDITDELKIDWLNRNENTKQSFIPAACYWPLTDTSNF